MTDEDAKEEERIMRSISRKPVPKNPRPVSMAVTTTIRSNDVSNNSIPQQPTRLAAPPQIVTSVTPRGTSTEASVPTATKNNNNSNDQAFARSVSTPSSAYVARMSSPPQFVSSSASPPIDIEQLKEKKRTLLGTVVTARRDLEEVRNEIAKLKQKESELIALMEKRENGVQQLTLQIEQLEHAEHSDKLTIEEHKRRIEEEKARKVKEEIEKRRKEEAEEERKRKEAEEEKRRKMVVNAPNYVGTAPVDVKISVPETHSNDTSVLRPVQGDVKEDDIEAEEARLIRAMSRQKQQANVNPARGSSYVKPPTQPVASVAPKPATEPHWKEQERTKEIERNQRLAEENRKKEEARRYEQERQSQEKVDETSRISALQHREGVNHTFYSPPIYSIEEVFICGDFTDWQEVPVDTDVQPKNFQFPITFPVSKGVHFYRFKVGQKWEVNKNNPTGVSPSGEVMNKVEIE